MFCKQHKTYNIHLPACLVDYTIDKTYFKNKIGNSGVLSTAYASKKKKYLNEMC